MPVTLIKKVVTVAVMAKSVIVNTQTRSSFTYRARVKSAKMIAMNMSFFDISLVLYVKLAHN